MTNLANVKRLVLILLLSLAVVSCARLANSSTSATTATKSKAELTPAFWQRDPDADFEDEGRQHCAPTAFSDGLIYLARVNNLKNLVPGTEEKKDQIKLIEELAEDFQTDPSKGGTNPDKVLTGLQSYVQRKGYHFGRLELVSWRPVSNSNKKFKIGSKPEIDWLRQAALSQDCVLVLNFGWYYQEEEGYRRNSGHWVIVVGAKPDSNQFFVNNPILSAADQAKKKSILLTQLNREFNVTDTGIGSVDEIDLKGYFDAAGEGLPHSNNIKAAILDAAIVFTIKK